MNLQAIKPKITKAVSSVNKQGSHASSNIAEAFKELAKQFKEIVEIGKFKELKVKIHEPLENCAINDAYLILKPLDNKNDFRTRVLTYIAESPFQEGVIREMAYVNGNKQAMDSALKDKSRISEFKSFLRQSERFFRSQVS